MSTEGALAGWLSESGLCLRTVVVSAEEPSPRGAPVQTFLGLGQGPAPFSPGRAGTGRVAPSRPSACSSHSSRAASSKSFSCLPFVGTPLTFSAYLLFFFFSPPFSLPGRAFNTSVHLYAFGLNLGGRHGAHWGQAFYC